MALAAVLPAQTNWHLATNQPLEGAQYSAMAYDLARDRCVLFGGLLGPNFDRVRGETWERIGTTWTRRTPLTGPSARSSHAMAYDIARQQVVMFGGSAGAGAYFADTWTWNGASWSLRSPATSPAPRAGHTLAYDIVRKRVVLFGGYDGAKQLGDTWEWDGSHWLLVAPTGPAARSDAAMAYDFARQRVVLFGGNKGTGSPSVLNDTWEWDGASWTQAAPATSPTPRAAAALAHDANRKTLVLFGGLSGSFASLDDTWEWLAGTWTLVNTTTTNPRPTRRYGHVLAYDHGRKSCVLHAGTNGQPFNDDWEWNGTQWSAIQPGGGVTPRARHSLAYDAARAEMVMFGGASARILATAETAVFDGWRWTSAPIMPSPTLARHHHAMAYDASRTRIVVFGGSGAFGQMLDDTWEWDGMAWLQKSVAARPAARRGHALAYDPVRQVTVLFGGTSGAPRNDTWTWNGTAWSQSTPATSPSPRSGAAMAFDGTSQKVLLFGGYSGTSYLGDTWEWDGTTWTERLGLSASPGGRSGHAMAADPVRKEIVLFGGSTAGGSLRDTWAWTGTTWSIRNTAVTPPLRTDHAMAYDPRSGLIVLFGGKGATEELSDLWYYGATTLAATQPLGTGCGGTSGAPWLTCTLPGLGNREFQTELGGAPAAAPGAILLAPGAQTLELGGGCTAYLQGPAALPTLTNPFGFASVRTPIPSDRALRGAAVYLQGFVLDPKGGIGGVVISPALKSVLGD